MKTYNLIVINGSFWVVEPKVFLFTLILFFHHFLAAQNKIEVQPDGLKLKQFYLSLGVEKKWLPGHHVEWETGAADKPDASVNCKTHCSLFVAAACKRFGLPIARPPLFSAQLLANTQYDWLISDSGYANGWRRLTDRPMISAQENANLGYTVIAACKNSNPKKPGHIAFVMPAEMIDTAIERVGPILIQAGKINSDSIPLRLGFGSHLHTWPDSTVQFFYNSKRIRTEKLLHAQGL